MKVRFFFFEHIKNLIATKERLALVRPDLVVYPKHTDSIPLLAVEVTNSATYDAKIDAIIFSMGGKYYSDVAE
nr:hypothetical protein [Clostridia bacterium]